MTKKRIRKPISIPVLASEYLRNIAIESARMSYPASMTRGENPPLKQADGKDTVKLEIERYFADLFPIVDIWDTQVRDFDRWHKKVTKHLSGFIRRNACVGKGRKTTGLATKFLNTFLYQLAKYPSAQFLYEDLHLPLDRKIFTRLARVDAEALAEVEGLLRKSPYTFNYTDYMKVQRALRQLTLMLNDRRDAEYDIQSNVEFNWLWAMPT